MTSDSDVNSANKRLPLTLSDAGFGESDCVEMHHIASTRSSLGVNGEAKCTGLQMAMLSVNSWNQIRQVDVLRKCEQR